MLKKFEITFSVNYASKGLSETIFFPAFSMTLEATHASWNRKRNFNLRSKEPKMGNLTFQSRDRFRVLHVHASREQSCERMQTRHSFANARMHTNLDFLAEVPGPLGAFSWDIDHIQVFRISCLSKFGVLSECMNLGEEVEQDQNYLLTQILAWTDFEL